MALLKEVAFFHLGSLSNVHQPSICQVRHRATWTGSSRGRVVWQWDGLVGGLWVDRNGGCGLGEGDSRIHAEPSPMSDTGLDRSGTMWVSCGKGDNGWGFTVYVALVAACVTAEDDF
jgi:hypothetical protein